MNFQIKILQGAALTDVLTIDQGESVVGSPEYQRTENEPATVSVRLWNLSPTESENYLSTSFAGWDLGGPGAIQLGYELGLYLYPTNYTTGEAGSATLVFVGYITDLQQGSDGILTITAHDPLKALDAQRVEKMCYSALRDQYLRQLAFVNSGIDYGLLAITGVDSDGYYPGVKIELLADDDIFGSGLDVNNSGTDDILLDEVGDKLACSFICDHDASLAIGFYVKVYSDDGTGKIEFHLCDDNGSDRPGTELYTVEWSQPLGSRPLEWNDIAWHATDPPQLQAGKKYWMVAECTALLTPGTSYFALRRDSGGTYLSDKSSPVCWLYNVSTTSWAPLTGNACLFLHVGKYRAINPADYAYHLDGAAHTLVIRHLGGSLPGLATQPLAQFVWTGGNLLALYRARCTYYYGTVTINTAVKDLVRLFPGAYCDGDTNASLTFPLYRAHGKTIGEAVRDLIGLHGYLYSAKYYQCSVCAWSSYQLPILELGRRRNTIDDTEVMTFGHGHDGRADNYTRIVGCDLRRTSRARPSTVVVVGRSPDGGPLIASRDDRGLGSNSFRTNSSIPLTETIYDESLASMDMVNKVAYRYLEEYARGHETTAWEGTLTVSGVYPLLIRTYFGGDASSCDGSGEIIKLYYKPMAISALKLKVKGIRIVDNTTEIRVTNDDALTRNMVNVTNRRALHSDAYLSPTAPEQNYFVAVAKSTVVTASTAYMQLCKSDGTILDSASGSVATRVKCTKWSEPSGVTDFNTNTYHATFAATNGYGTIERIELYDAATGGSQLAEFDFSAVVDSSAEIYKSKTMAVIVDFHCRQS